MPPTGVFSDFLLAAALSVQLAIAVPLFFYYSQQPEGRTRLQSWFIWPAVLSTAMISAYLLAGIDYRLFRKANVWDVFLTAGALLVVLAITLAVRANRAHADATRPAAPDG